MAESHEELEEEHLVKQAENFIESESWDKAKKSYTVPGSLDDMIKDFWVKYARSVRKNREIGSKFVFDKKIDIELLEKK